MISGHSITLAIEAYFRGLESGARSSMGALLEMAERGTPIQSQPDPEAGLGRWDPWPMRFCTPEDMAVLRAYYLPDPPRVMVVGYSTQIGAGKRTVSVPLTRRRRSTDAEVAADLELAGPREAARRLHDARGRVLDGLRAREREHTQKCE